MNEGKNEKAKLLGKIESVSFGHGGYQDSMLGLHVTISGDGWGVGSTESAWDAEIIECSKRSRWTEGDRSQRYDLIMRRVSKLLKEAKVRSVSDLKGVPVEVTFKDSHYAGSELESWRVLTEVL